MFLKIYLDASTEIRAKRRYFQLKDKGINGSLAQVVEEMRDRDLRDKSRTTAPMVPASDAIMIDTTEMNIEQVFDLVFKMVKERTLLLA